MLSKIGKKAKTLAYTWRHDRNRLCCYSFFKSIITLSNAKPYQGYNAIFIYAHGVGATSFFAFLKNIGIDNINPLFHHYSFIGHNQANRPSNMIAIDRFVPNSPSIAFVLGRLKTRARAVHLMRDPVSIVKTYVNLELNREKQERPLEEYISECLDNKNKLHEMLYQASSYLSVEHIIEDALPLYTSDFLGANIPPTMERVARFLATGQHFTLDKESHRLGDIYTRALPFEVELDGDKYYLCLVSGARRQENGYYEVLNDILEIGESDYKDLVHIGSIDTRGFLHHSKKYPTLEIYTHKDNKALQDLNLNKLENIETINIAKDKNHIYIYMQGGRGLH